MIFAYDQILKGIYNSKCVKNILIRILFSIIEIICFIHKRLIKLFQLSKEWGK